MRASSRTSAAVVRIAQRVRVGNQVDAEERRQQRERGEHGRGDRPPPALQHAGECHRDDQRKRDEQERGAEREEAAEQRRDIALV